MPWNEPGGNGKNNDPWGNKEKQSPPDLDKILNDFIQKLRSFFASKNSDNKWGSGAPSSREQRFGIGAAVAALLIIWFVSGIFVVNPAEEAVILRFGKFSEVVKPGLHWFARFVESKYLVDVQKIYSFSLDGDFLTKSSDQSDMPSQYVQVNTKKEGISDQSKNLVNVELNVQYRISQPNAYLFNIVNPDETVRQVATGALSDVIGKMKLDDVLTTGREFVSSGVLERTRQVLNSYNAGLEVVAVTLRKVQAPDQVRAAFSDVNRADQDKATLIQQAQAYASKVVPLAQGVAARIMADATGYQQQVVLNAQANIARFEALQKVYATSPDVTRERMYMEAIQNVLTRTTKILVDSNSANNMMYLPLDKLFARTHKNAAAGLKEDKAAGISQLLQNGNAQTDTGNNEEGKNVAG